MSRLDTSDPQIKKELDALTDPKTTDNWVVLAHVGNTTKVKVVEKGEDWDELIDEMNSGKIMYVLARFMIDRLYKFVFIAWVGDGIDGVAKGRSGGYIKDMEYFLKGRYHLQVNARNEDDMEKDDILKRLKLAKGANFDAQLSKQQREQKTSLHEIKETIEQSKVKEVKKTEITIDKTASEKFWSKNQETKSEYVVKKDDYNKKEESAKFWEKQKRLEEEERKRKEQAPQKPDIKSVTEQSKKFWSQQQQQEEEEKKEVVKPVIKSDTKNLRARFEQMAMEKQTPVAKPPPPKPLAKKFPPPPVPVKEEPVQEDDGRQEEELRRQQEEKELRRQQEEEEEERRRQEEEEEWRRQQEEKELRKQQEEEEWRRQQEEEELGRQQEEEEWRRQQEEEEWRRQQEEEEWRRQQEEEELRRQQEEEELRRREEEERLRLEEEEERLRREEEEERLRSEELQRAKINKLPPPPVPKKVEDTRKQVIGLYDFDTPEDEELPFKEGDILYVIQEDDGGWWTAENAEGKQGLIPANYVELYQG